MCCRLCMARNNTETEQNRDGGGRSRKQEASEDGQGDLQVRDPARSLSLTRRQCIHRAMSTEGQPQVQVYQLLHYLGRKILSHGIPVCSCCHSKIAQTWWSIQQTFVFSEFWRLKSWRSRYWQVWFLWGLSRRLVVGCLLIAIHSLSSVCAHPWCLCVSPYFLFLYRHESHWVRAHPDTLILD